MNRVDELTNKLFGGSPFKSFLPQDSQGFFTDSEVFNHLIKIVKPKIIIEVGSWKGHSAISMAKSLRAEGSSDSRILCVDTWGGSIEHWRSEKWKDDLHLRHGYPTLYERFLSNIIRSGLEDLIVPMPMHSQTAAKLLVEDGIRADLIYIDAAHDYDSVMRDLESFYPLLTEQGILFGDDYPSPSVAMAASSFAKKYQLRLLTRGRKFVLAKTQQLDQFIAVPGFFKQEGLANKPQMVSVLLNLNNLPDSYKKLGDAFREGGQLEEADFLYRKAIQCQSNNAEVFYHLGLLLIDQEKFDEAIECLVQALRINPVYALARESLGRLVERQEGPNSTNAKLVYSGVIPKGLVDRCFELKPEDTIVSSTQLEQATCIEVFPESQFFPLPPKTLESQIPEVLAIEARKVDRSFVVEIPDGRAWGDGVNSAVITPDHKLLADLSTGSAELVFFSSQIKRPTEIDGTVVFLTQKFMMAGNYFHWMFNVLPKFDVLRRSGIDLSCVEKYAIYRSDRPFIQETLNILGVAGSKIIQSCNHPHIKAKSLIVPSPIVHIPSKQNCDFLRSQFLPESSIECKNHQPERIFITRQEAAYRHILNEEELITCLKRFDIHPVRLETLSVLEQAALFSQAKVVVAPHGAGLTNLVFCQPGTKVIEIFPRDYVVAVYHLISNHCGLQYYYLSANAFENQDCPLKYQKQNYLDMQINLDELSSLLEFAGVA